MRPGADRQQPPRVLAGQPFKRYRFGYRSVMRKPLTLAAIGLAGDRLGRAGCGDDNGNGGSTTPTTTEGTTTFGTTTDETTTEGTTTEGTTTGEEDDDDNGGGSGEG